MKCIKLSALAFLALWLPPVNCQHLMATPNFCAGNLCISSGPIIRDEIINFPSFSFFQKDKIGSTVYIIKYRDFGQIMLSMIPTSLKNCDRINARADRKNKIIDAVMYDKNLCTIMPSGKIYILDISLHGLDSVKSRDLCSQAFDGLWAFESFSSTQSKYEPIYTKIDFDLECPK